MLSLGMNGLRMDVRARQLNVTGTVEDGGYHFTSVGSIDDIRKKIESWGHQEFNNPRIIKFLMSPALYLFTDIINTSYTRKMITTIFNSACDIKLPCANIHPKTIHA